MEERWEGGEETLWLAPVEEGEEGYMGLFSEEELRAAFPHLAAEHSDSGGTAEVRVERQTDGEGLGGRF